MTKKWSNPEILDLFFTLQSAVPYSTLNPQDYDIWSKVEPDTRTKSHKSLVSLKKSLNYISHDKLQTRVRTRSND